MLYWILLTVPAFWILAYVGYCLVAHPPTWYDGERNEFSGDDE